MTAKQFSEKFTARVSGESPRAASPWCRANCFREARTIYPASQTRATIRRRGLSMCRPRLLLPVFKSRCARRELCPKGTSYRPNGRTWPEGQPRASTPPILLNTRRTAPLTPAASRRGATGPRYGQGGYTGLESVSLSRVPSQCGRGGSRKRTYGLTAFAACVRRHEPS